MNLLENFGIQVQSVAADRVVLTVTVTDQLKQPYGIVHGGVNAVLAETAASLGANQWLRDHGQDKLAIGLNINTQHLRPVAQGTIKAIATPIKCGRRTQTWRAELYNQDQLTSSSTVILINSHKPEGKPN